MKQLLILQCVSASWTPRWLDSFDDSYDVMFMGCYKRANVFGVGICLTENAWEGDQGVKANHIANVLAQYLDNDADGEVDDQQVVDRMILNHATLLVGQNEDDLADYAD